MVLKDVYHCKLCNERIVNPGSAVFCREKKTVNCVSCEKDFTYECRKRVRVFCSRQCSLSTKSKQRSSKLKQCKECGDSFVGIYSRLYCQKIIAGKCNICGKDFVDSCGRKRKSNSCGPSCANLKKDWISNPKKLDEWKNINQWTTDFSNRNNRKPSMKDLENYFQVRVFPSKGNRELFHLTNNRSSRLEEIVASYLTRKDISFKRNTRPLTIAGSKLEIDFILYEVNFGIEVQDFATHSLTKIPIIMS